MDKADIRKKIIKKIRENKISTTEVADVLGKKGHIEGPKPITGGEHIVGEVDVVFAYKESNWEVHEQMETINSKRIVYVHAIECNNKAIFGDLVSKYVLLYKGSSAIVVNGLLRDAHTLIKEEYPIWCTGFTPIGCKNVKNESLPEYEEEKLIRNKFEGGVMVCDDSGVVLIEDEFINETFLEKLDFIELQEDIWFFCLDVLKMSTYEIVCEKKYLHNSSVSKEKLEELSRFSTEK